MSIKFTYQDHDFSVGDTVKVNYKIKEKDKERIQAFDGIILAITGTGDNKNFTVQKAAADVLADGRERVGVRRNSVRHAASLRAVGYRAHSRAYAARVRDLGQHRHRGVRGSHSRDISTAHGDRTTGAHGRAGDTVYHHRDILFRSRAA